MNLRTGVLASLTLFLVSCIHSTPMAPAPLEDREAPKLAAALMGTCVLTHVQKEGGEPKKDEGLAFTFGNDGAGQYNALGILGKFKYQIEGRNVVMQGPYTAFRVDDYSSSTLKLFVYDRSETWFCQKQ